MGKQHLFGSGTVRIILVRKPDMGVIDFKDAVACDSDLPESSSGQVMGITSEIFHHPVWGPEGSLGMDVVQQFQLMFQFPISFEYIAPIKARGAWSETKLRSYLKPDLDNANVGMQA